MDTAYSFAHNTLPDMKLQIDFSEIRRMVNEKYHFEMVMKHVNSRTVGIGAAVSLGPFTRDVTIDVKVDRVEGGNLILAYNPGLGMDLAVKGILALLKNQSAEYGQIVESGSKNNVIIHLNNIDAMRNLLQSVDLKGISFIEQGMLMEASIKPLS